MEIGDRIKLIMEDKGYSKNALAKQIGIHPTTLNNWITGKTKADNLKLDALCDFLKINIDWLITGDGEMLLDSSESDENIKPNPNDEAKLITNPNIKMIPLVSQYAQAGYLSGFADAEYMETLPRVPFIVDHEPHGNYMSFEVRGDSMFDGSSDSLVEGDLLMCREIDFDYWKSKLFINKWKNFVVVHRTEGVLVKKIIDHDVERGIITLHSLNPMYKDIKICLSEVAQLFSVVKIMRSGDK